MATIFASSSSYYTSKKCFIRNFEIYNHVDVCDFFINKHFKLFWSSSVTESQKQVISQMIRNMVYVRGGEYALGLDPDAKTVTVSDFYISKY